MQNRETPKKRKFRNSDNSVQDHLGFVEVLLFECLELPIVAFCLLLILDDGQKKAHFCAVYQTKGLIIASLPLHISHACSQKQTHG